MALKEASTQAIAPQKKTISLRWLMILGFGGIVALSISLVLFISVSANFANTFSLLGSRATILIDGMQRSISAQTNQAENAVRALEKAYKIGDLTIDDPQSHRPLLSTLMSAIPVVEAILIYNVDGNRSGLARKADGTFMDISYGLGTKADQEAFAENTKGTISRQPIWGETVFLNGVLFHNVAIALIKDKKLEGVAIAAIGRHTINRIISQLGKKTDATAFIITEDKKLVAHSQIPGAFRGKRNIPLEKFPDPAMREFANASIMPFINEEVGENTTFYEADSLTGKGGHVYITRKIKSISPDPYILGAYFTKADAGEELLRALKSAIAGLVALVLAVLAAVFLGRRLSKPLHKISRVADKFSRLELDNFTPLPHSRIREIDDSANAMNSMHHALIEFSRYVPRTLVKKLLLSGAEATRSVEREVTVMFSDIVGFTAMSEKLNAVETADLLNAHFDLMGKFISDNNGTVDKFIGDGIMAFWGAPDADNDHATNAIIAAQQIVEAKISFNENRIAMGLPPVRIRIGIHTGRAVVGNIGSAQRQNYTMVGDVVNVSQRLEQLGKQLGGNPQSIVLVSDSTRIKAKTCENFVAIGLHHLKGRQKPVLVYALKVDDIEFNSTSEQIDQNAAG